jgi:hypothetical protein
MLLLLHWRLSSLSLLPLLLLLSLLLPLLLPHLPMLLPLLLLAVPTPTRPDALLTVAGTL